MQPHRWQPTRLPRPWDSPGKNTGVGCHCLLQCMNVKSESEIAQSCSTLRDPMDCSLPGSSVHGISQARVLEWSAIAFSVRDAYDGPNHILQDILGKSKLKLKGKVIEKLFIYQALKFIYQKRLRGGETIYDSQQAVKF